MIREGHASSVERHSDELVTLWVSQGLRQTDPARIRSIAGSMLARSQELAEAGQEQESGRANGSTTGQASGAPAKITPRQGLGQAIRGLGDYSKVKRP